MALAEWRSRIALPRIDRRTVLGGTLAAASALLVLILTRPIPTAPILVATGEVPAGVPLATAKVGVRWVTDTDGFVVGDSVGDLAEWTLAAPLGPGEPLLPSLLRSPERTAAPDVMSLEVPAGRAVLGRLNPGDLVDVYVTQRDAAGVAATTLAAEKVVVVEVHERGSSVGVPTIGLVVGVDRALAATLSEAVATGDLHLVRVGP